MIHSSKEFIQYGSQAFKELGRPCRMYDFVAENALEMFATGNFSHGYHRLHGPPKHCFRNAALAAQLVPILTYCEGYVSSVIPVLHAWCLSPEGEVVELTLEKPGSDYFGIPFQLSFLVQQLQKNRSYGLLDQWENGNELISGRYPKAMWFEETALARLALAATLKSSRAPATDKKKPR